MPNGDVVFCSNDWRQELVLGNLWSESFETIEERREFFVAQQHLGEIGLCKKCEYAMPLRFWSKAAYPVRVIISQCIAGIQGKNKTGLIKEEKNGE